MPSEKLWFPPAPLGNHVVLDRTTVNEIKIENKINTQYLFCFYFRVGNLFSLALFSFPLSGNFRHFLN